MSRDELERDWIFWIFVLIGFFVSFNMGPKEGTWGEYWVSHSFTGALGRIVCIIMGVVIGGVVGYLVSFILESGLGITVRSGERKEKRKKNIVYELDKLKSTIVSIGAHMAYVDGVPSEAKTEILESFIEYASGSCNLSWDERLPYKKIIDDISQETSPKDGIYMDAQTLMSIVKERNLKRWKCQKVYRLLWDLAYVDGELSPNDEEILHNICPLLELSDNLFVENYKRWRYAYLVVPIMAWLAGVCETTVSLEEFNNTTDFPVFDVPTPKQGGLYRILNKIMRSSFESDIQLSSQIYDNAKRIGYCSGSRLSSCLERIALCRNLTHKQADMVWGLFKVLGIGGSLEFSGGRFYRRYRGGGEDLSDLFERGLI